MAAVAEVFGLISEEDVDVAFSRASAALTDALALLGAFDAQGGWEIAGAGSAVAWLAGRGHCTRTEAAAHVRNARLMREHAEVHVAVTEGTITPSHVSQLATVARHRSQRFTADVAELVDVAGRMSAEDFRTPVRYWRTLADDHVLASLICGERTAGFGKTAGGQPVKGKLFGCQSPGFSRKMRTQRTAKQ